MPAITRPLSSRLLRISALALAAALGAPIAQAQTVINNQTVTVPPDTAPTGNLTVGSTGTGVLNIVSGGVVTTNLSRLGDLAGSLGTVNVSGTGQWSAGGITVGSQGTGILNVTSGGQVTSSGLTVGSFAGSLGTVTVDGSGTQLTSSSSVYLGDDGNGTINVANGATFTTNNNAFYISAGDSTGTFNVSGGSTVLSGSTYVGYCGGGCSTSEGVANVSGAGTLWAMGSLVVGYEDSEGTLNISGGAAVVAAGDVSVGYFENSPGHISISGAGSQFVTSGIADAYIGIGSSADVTVSNGGHFEVARDTFIAYGSDSESSVTITGAGSSFTAGGGAVSVGYAGDGSLSVLNGATATTGLATIGQLAGSNGTVTVSGNGSVWDNAGVTVGYQGTGTLIINNGGVVNSTGDAIVGDQGDGSSATVTGAGSQWNLGNNDLTVGNSAIATVTVTNGGVLTTTGDITIAYATDAYGVFNVTNGGKVYSGDVEMGSYGHPMYGEMNVSGAGSEWHVTGEIAMTQDYGATVINVTNGGLLTATDGLDLGGYGSYPDDYANMTVSGAGSRVELGSGNTYIGSGAVANLLITDGGAFTAADMYVGNGSGLAATITLANGGSLTADSMELRESAVLNFGAAAGSPAAATGTFTVPTVTFSGSGGTIVFNHTNSMTFGAALASSNPGDGDVQVLAGTTTFTAGTGAYSGDIGVSGGKAVFNANVGGDVTVSGSGVVGGVGSIASLDVQTGGTVSPGNSPGTLTVAGPVSFASGTHYIVEVAGGVSDRIAATGPATLTGGTVYVSGSPSLMQYLILTAGGGVTGTFDGVESTSAFILYSLDYEPNDVYLLVDGYNSLTTAARTPNQYAVAKALDKFPADNPLYSAIIGGGIAGAQQAFNALSGEIHGSVGSAMADDSRYVREAITGRLIQAYYGGVGAGGGTPIVMAAAAPTDVVEMDTSSRMSLGAGYGASRAAPAADHDLAWWSRAFGAWGQYDSNGNAATTDRNLGGFVTGVDGNMGSGWRAGLATGYLNTSLSAGGERYSSADINSYVLGAYAGGGIGEFALRSGGTWTWNKIDTDRSVVFPGFFEGESASYNGDVGQLFAELAYPIFTHGGVIEPFAGLAYVHVGTDSFTENGPIAGLTSGGLNMNLGYGTLGARAGTTVVWGGTTVIPHVSAAWQYAFGDTTPEIAMAFASTGIGMGIGGIPLAQNSALFDIGADAVIAQDMTLGLSYMGQYSGDFTDNGLRGRFNWRF